MSELILIDANALVDFFVGEPDLRQASEDLRRSYPQWLTLPLCRYEFGNVLRTYVRLDKIDELDGHEILRDGLAMVRFCSECEEDAVLAEANRSHLTFYDAAYVAQARSLGLWLHTRDGAILRNCPDVARPIEGF